MCEGTIPTIPSMSWVIFRLDEDHLLHIKEEFSVVAGTIMEETIVTKKILP